MDEDAERSARYKPGDWDSGGERSRRVYLHPEEYFPIAAVRRGGEVRPLPALVQRYF